MPISYRQKVDEALLYLKNSTEFSPDFILLLGTGLGDLAAKIKAPHIIPYSTIPHFCCPTVETHQGNLILGILGDKKVAALQGRLHFYEGYSTAEITFPIRVLSLMGCRYLIASNAAGGLNLNFQPGNLMVITDHLNFMGENPLRGSNIEAWGPRFPDMSEVYSKNLAKLALQTAESHFLTVKTGTYVCIPGPSLETPAETRYLRNCGADAVGMSTVPEVIVGKHAGLEILAVSVIANTNDPDNFEPIILDDVINKVKEIAPDFQKLIISVLRKIKC